MVRESPIVASVLPFLTYILMSKFDMSPGAESATSKRVSHYDGYTRADKYPIST